MGKENFSAHGCAESSSVPSNNSQEQGLWILTSFLLRSACIRA